MKIKLSEVTAIKGAHEALDGFQRASKDAAGKETVVFERHKYPAKVTWNRVAITGLMKSLNDKVEGQRIALQEEFSIKPGDELAKDHPANVKWREMMALEEDVPLLALSQADLNLYDPKENPEGNVIAAAIIVGLGPLLLS